MATAIEDSVRETLKCVLCSETLTNPRTLPCMHTYCCKCLDKLDKKKQGQKYTLSCPECRQEHEIPEGGVAKFKVNYTTSTLVDLLLSIDTVGDKPLCAICKENDHKDVGAVTKCIQCNEQFCKDCDQHHIRFHKDHMLLNLTGDKTKDKESELDIVKQRVVYCDKHKTNPLEIYCKVDQCALCAICFATNHSSHECMDIHKAAEENMSLIDDLLKKGDKLLENYEQVIQNTQTMKAKMEQEADDVTHALNNDMNTAIQAIRDKYTKKIDLVAEKRASYAQETETHIEHLQMLKATTESTMSQLRTLKQHGHDTHLANMTKDIASRSKAWSAPEVPEFEHNIIFKLFRGKVDDNGIMFGKVDINISSDTPFELPKTFKIVKSETYRIRDLAVTSKHKIIATGTRTHVYNKDLTMKMTFGEQFLNVTTKGDNIYLTSNTDTVHIYNQDGTHSRDIKIPTLENCKGIAVNSQGELVICDLYTATVCHVDSSTGRVLTKSGTFSLPLYVAVNSKDVVIVSDYYAHCVVGMTRDGKELFRYGTKGSGQNELCCPRCVCTDTADNIIVADCHNHRIHLLGPDGKFIKYLLTSSDGLKYPQAVAVDNDGQLLVGDDDDNIWVVKYT